MASNYEDVLQQLRDASLIVDHLTVGDGRIHRVPVEGTKEKKGWYILHEVRIGDDDVIVGAFGVYQGADPCTQKVSLGKRTLNTDQKEALRKRLAEDRRRAQAAAKSEAARAARRAQAAWGKCDANGESDYLKRKGIAAHGLRFTQQGALAVPIADAAGKIHGLQFILSKTGHAERIKKTGRDKEYWPAGLAKKGHFHLIGLPTWVVLIAEGYATAASLHEATGLPVVVAFDATNLLPVAEAIRARYRDAKIMLCADDDAFSESNPGITKASAAALAVNGQWMAPQFVDESARREAFETRKQKITDFNDLHAIEGLHTVRVQVEAKLRELGWLEVRRQALERATGEMGNSQRSYNFSIDILLNSFTLIYTTETVFDGVAHQVMSLSSLRAAAGKSLVRMWLEHPERKTVEPLQVVFDPTRPADDTTVCNLWAGWPTKPKAGTCERLLELLKFLLSSEENDQEVYDWMVKWLAYPLQHPGAKMQTALLMHGPEGSGKNTFFGCVRKMYARYGGIFTQTELESQYNGWASGKLFMIGNEVVTRAELYTQQGRVQNMITETEWQVNEKYLPSRLESNHCNFVFFSNRVDIGRLNDDDRRFLVIWTLHPLGKDFYDEVVDEINQGGIEALHDYLLNVPLGNFSPHTKPPMTKAKRDLIDLSMDSTQRFYRDWTEYVDEAKRMSAAGVPCCPAASEDLYAGYRWWCSRQGIQKPATLTTLLTVIAKKTGVRKERRWVLINTGQIQTRLQKTVIFPPGQSAPAGAQEAQWVSAEVDAFAFALEDARQQRSY